jgi:hypothetical protein
MTQNIVSHQTVTAAPENPMIHSSQFIRQSFGLRFSRKTKEKSEIIDSILPLLSS